MRFIAVSSACCISPRPLPQLCTPRHGVPGCPNSASPSRRFLIFFQSSPFRLSWCLRPVREFFPRHVSRPNAPLFPSPCELINCHYLTLLPAWDGRTPPFGSRTGGARLGLSQSIINDLKGFLLLPMAWRRAAPMLPLWRRWRGLLPSGSTTRARRRTLNQSSVPLLLLVSLLVS